MIKWLNIFAWFLSLFGIGGGNDKARDDAYSLGKCEAENATLEGQYADALKQGQAWADRPVDDASFDRFMRDAEARASNGKPEHP